jgi:hypothetical protein
MKRRLVPPIENMSSETLKQLLSSPRAAEADAELNRRHEIWVASLKRTYKRGYPLLSEIRSSGR